MYFPLQTSKKKKKKREKKKSEGGRERGQEKKSTRARHLTLIKSKLKKKKRIALISHPKSGVCVAQYLKRP